MNVFTYGDDFEVREADIPNPSARRTGTYDPRPPQMTLHRTYGQRMSLRNDFEANEIVIHAFDHTVTLSELKYAAAEFRKLDPQLERIVIFLSPENYRENFDAVRHLKFERTIAREDAANRDFCVVRQCKVKPQQPVDEATAARTIHGNATRTNQGFSISKNRKSSGEG